MRVRSLLLQLFLFLMSRGTSICLDQAQLKNSQAVLQWRAATTMLEHYLLRYIGKRIKKGRSAATVQLIPILKKYK